MNKEQSIQDSLYGFPYHYLPHFDHHGTPRRSRYLKWGFEYLIYQYHALSIARREQIESALEFGCGDGFFIGNLGPDVHERIGTDFSSTALRLARSFQPDVLFISETDELGAKTFDLVAAIEVLEHIPDDEIGDFLKTIWARVSPGGRLLISVPTTNTPLHKKHYRHYNAQILRSQLRNSGIMGNEECLDFVFGPPKLLELFLRATCNSYLLIEVAVINRVIWNYLWKRRLSSESKGKHIIMAIRK